MSSLSLCYMTPSFRGDLERFALLRRSLQLFSPDIPHLAYVDTEDCPLFQKRFGSERNLTIVPSAEILPARVEAERRFWRGRRGWLARRIGWRLGLSSVFTGWKLQQIIKLEAAARVPFDAVVFLDSDIFLCGRVTERDFVADGALTLLETPAANYEDMAFEVGRQLLVEGSLQAPVEAFNYIHQAPRFLRRTAMALLDRLSASHKNWHAALLQQAFPSEYNLLGYAARVLDGYRGYRLEMTPRSEWLYEVKERSVLGDQMALCRRERGRRKFFLIQSNMRLPEDDYLRASHALIEDLAGGVS